MTINYQDPRIMKYFTIYGILVFLGVAGFDLYSIIQSWNLMSFANKGSAILMTSFYLALAFIFYCNYKAQKNLSNINSLFNDQEINKTIKEVKHAKSNRRRNS